MWWFLLDTIARTRRLSLYVKGHHWRVRAAGRLHGICRCGPTFWGKRSRVRILSLFCIWTQLFHSIKLCIVYHYVTKAVNGYFKDWLHFVALHSTLGSNTELFLCNMTQQHAWHVCVLMLPWWASWRLGVTPFLLMQKRWCLASNSFNRDFSHQSKSWRMQSTRDWDPPILYPPIGLLHPGHAPRKAADIDWIWLLRERLETSLLGTARVFCCVIPNEIRINKYILSAPTRTYPWWIQLTSFLFKKSSSYLF